MALKPLILAMPIVFVAALGFVGESVDTTAPGWVTLQQAEAGEYRRSVRRAAHDKADFQTPGILRLRLWERLPRWVVSSNGLTNWMNRDDRRR